MFLSDDVTTGHLLCNYGSNSIWNLKKVFHNILFSPSVKLNKSDLFLVQHLVNILSWLFVHVDGFQRCINWGCNRGSTNDWYSARGQKLKTARRRTEKQKYRKDRIKTDRRFKERKTKKKEFNICQKRFLFFHKLIVNYNL